MPFDARINGDKTELWNDLPLHVKNSQTLAQFRLSLKTHLFTLAF